MKTSFVSAIAHLKTWGIHPCYRYKKVCVGICQWEWADSLQWTRAVVNHLAFEWGLKERVEWGLKESACCWRTWQAWTWTRVSISFHYAKGNDYLSIVKVRDNLPLSNWDNLTHVKVSIDSSLSSSSLRRHICNLLAIITVKRCTCNSVVVLKE